VSVISIDWATKIISVPRDYMTLVQATPIEIRELNINQFRLDLKALEASEIGMTFLDTHRHNTEVLLGGIIYAMVVEIINGYTVTFENGAYAVNLIGANSNIGDVINLNTVSVRSNNAAGLISNAAIEYASFNGGVTIDVTSANTGTVFPTGTPQKPVNNISDAMLIASVRGFTRLYIIGDIELDIGDDVSNMTLIGQSQNESSIIVHGGATVTNSQFNDATINGEFDGMAVIKSCAVENIDFFDGIIEECMLTGIIKLLGFGKTNLRNCYDGLPGLGTPIINCNGDGQDIGVWDYYGGLVLQNKTGDDSISINMATGRLVIESTVTNGTILVKGVGLCDDNSTGTADVNTDGLISTESVVRAVQDAVYIDTDDGDPGTTFPIGTKGHPVSNIDDAYIIATQMHLSKYTVHGSIVLNRTYEGWVIQGECIDDTVDLGGCDIQNSYIKNLKVIGIQGGTLPALFNECYMADVVGVNGQINNCVIYDSISVGASGSIVVIRGCIGIGVTGSVVVDAIGLGRTIVGDNLGGGWTIKNAVWGPPPTIFQLGFGSGNLTIDPSCTGGTIVATGVVSVSDNSTGAMVHRDAQLQAAPGAYNGSVCIDTVNGTDSAIYPCGTQSKPVKTLTNATTIANSLGIRNYSVRGPLTINVPHEGFTITGIGSILTDIITITSGTSVANSKFIRCTVAGTVAGTNVQYENCTLSNLSNVQGLALDTTIFGTLSLAAASTFIGRGLSGSTIMIDLVGGGGHSVQFNGVGAFTIANAGPGDMIQAGISVGSITVDTTCVTGSVIAVIGDCSIIDNGVGAYVVDGTTVKHVWDTQPQIG